MRTVDVETMRSPMELIVGARNALDSIRLFLIDVEDRREGLELVMRDPRRRAMVLDHVAFVGEYLARLTVVLTDLDAEGIAKLRDDVQIELMAAAADIAFARARASRSEIPSKEAAPPTE